ncbi:major urinary protein 20-like [Macrotis lagotis]|uniref:major urinary protein 20-like n=1 Tax=Macrotis lagotis TaxID=92651 RepID=UPI003D6971CF
MKILLLTIVLALVCDLQAQDTNMENPAKITGEWFTVALASDDPSKIMKGGKMEMFIHYVILDNDDGHNDISIEILEPEYLIVVLTNIKDGKITKWAELLGRTPDLSDERKERFKEICRNNKIGADQIRDLSKEGIPRMKHPCVSANHSHRNS